jgi:hypothetical protein
MKAHILITNNETLPVCRDRLFWGVGIPNAPTDFREWISPKNSRKPFLKMLVDMLNINIGDLVFLYERQVGFHGVYKVDSQLFFDTTKISNKGGLFVDEQWPLRILLKNVYYFPKAVNEDLLFSTPKYENIFWIWAYRKSQGARGCNTITPEAAEALIELLVKVNGRDVKYANFDPYKPQKLEKIQFSFTTQNSKVVLEDYLRGYIVNKMTDCKEFEKFLGKIDDIEWYANNVPYHITQKNIDILVFHKNFRYTNAPLRYKYSVIELKKDIVKPNDVSQLIRYAQWTSGRLANGEVEMIQPILIGHDFSDDAIKKSKSTDFNERGIILVKYKAVNNKKITFEII